jgi:organic radical activating enzyme
MSKDLIELRKQLIESEVFCFYPFLELSTNPAGHIKPCCYYGDVLFKDPSSKDYADSLSLAKGDKLEDVWNSQSMIDIRRKLVEGEHNSLCSTCYRDGAASMRTRSIKENKDRLPIIKQVSESIANDYRVTVLPSRLELKPSNLCNLKCVMCNKYDSTQVEKELLELSNKYGGINVKTGRFISINLDTPGITEVHNAFKDVSTANWSDNPDLWSSLIKIIPTLEHLSFAGGEPMLIPVVEKILRYCVDNDYAKNIQVSVASNFTSISKAFLELMPKFKKFELISSIDAIGKVNEYARFPS